MLAAALAGHADSITTQNLKDFPAKVLEPLGITALHPVEFLLRQLELEPLFVLPAFKAMSARLRNPKSPPKPLPAAWKRMDWCKQAPSCDKHCN